jgi:hypothetical protein
MYELLQAALHKLQDVMSMSTVLHHYQQLLQHYQQTDF